MKLQVLFMKCRNYEAELQICLLLVSSLKLRKEFLFIGIISTLHDVPIKFHSNISRECVSNRN